MMRIRNIAFASVLAVATAACGGSSNEGPKGPGAKPSGKIGADGTRINKAAAEGYARALEAFVKHDEAQDWNDSSCNSVAEEFLDAAKKQGKPFPEALYNAGLAYQRCGNTEKARAQFEAAKKASGDFHRARAQLILYELNSDHSNLDQVIKDLEQVIRDAKFQNVEALVSVAALQMERNNDQADQDGKNDLERAKKNIQRALAIDDSYMPAFNQLAIYYLELARQNAEKGSKRKHSGRRSSLVVAGAEGLDVNRQQLDLAALVAAQAIKKNPNYAPIHNTAGLIQVELKNYNGAVRSFGRARSLDKKFFEAHMNYAAVSLSFRAFEKAAEAYRDALKLKPKEYEAHLGLALALRGQINDSNFDKMLAEAEKHLAEARKIAPERPETYYNEAILTQEYKAKGSQKDAIPMLEKAAKLYDQFVAKAGSQDVFAEAVKRSKERSQDIRDTIKFIQEGEASKNAPPPPASGG